MVLSANEAVWALSGRFDINGYYSEDTQHADASTHYQWDDKVRLHTALLMAAIVSASKIGRLDENLKLELRAAFQSGGDEMKVIENTYQALHDNFKTLQRLKEFGENIPPVYYNGTLHQCQALLVFCEQECYKDTWHPLFKQLRIFHLDQKREGYHTGGQCQSLKNFFIDKEVPFSKFILITDDWHLTRVWLTLLKNCPKLAEEVKFLGVNTANRGDAKLNRTMELHRLITYTGNNLIASFPSEPRISPRLALTFNKANDQQSIKNPIPGNSARVQRPRLS